MQYNPGVDANQQQYESGRETGRLRSGQCEPKNRQGQAEGDEQEREAART